MTGVAGRTGRPRSEQSRAAILHAVDDLVAEVGYSGVTFKGIAERAGVSRQTIYRWWSTKAEILLEASAIDARAELAVPPRDDPLQDVASYLDALIRFLVHSDAGSAYRALLGEAQYDDSVRALLSGNDIVGDSAAAVVRRAVPREDLTTMARATADLVGPAFFWILSGRDPRDLDTTDLARGFLDRAARQSPGRETGGAPLSDAGDNGKGKT